MITLLAHVAKVPSTLLQLHACSCRLLILIPCVRLPRSISCCQNKCLCTSHSQQLLSVCCEGRKWNVHLCHGVGLFFEKKGCSVVPCFFVLPKINCCKRNARKVMFWMAFESSQAKRLKTFECRKLVCALHFLCIRSAVSVHLQSFSWCIFVNDTCVCHIHLGNRFSGKFWSWEHGVHLQVHRHGIGWKCDCDAHAESSHLLMKGKIIAVCCCFDRTGASQCFVAAVWTLSSKGFSGTSHMHLNSRAQQGPFLFMGIQWDRSIMETVSLWTCSLVATSHGGCGCSVLVWNRHNLFNHAVVCLWCRCAAVVVAFLFAWCNMMCSYCFVGTGHFLFFFCTCVHWEMNCFIAGLLHSVVRCGFAVFIFVPVWCCWMLMSWCWFFHHDNTHPAYNCTDWMCVCQNDIIEHHVWQLKAASSPAQPSIDVLQRDIWSGWFVTWACAAAAVSG